ncbi:MAG: hypothetical protein COA85_04340 [Robiginitomaculum sp.]|nr:MAG: hypothetical protein COA85_04340 [Robiginitomaculum sp.]
MDMERTSHVVIARFIRAIQFFFNLDYRDKPGNDNIRHSGEGRNPDMSHNWTPACAGVTQWRGI